MPTHFIRRLNMREQLIREVEIIPLEVVVRNVAAGSLSQRLGHRGRHGAAALDHRVLLQERRARRPDGVRRSTSRRSAGPTPPEIDEIMALAIRVNDFLVGLFCGIGIRLVDFKVEFGRLLGKRADAHRRWPTRSARTVAGCGTQPRHDKLDKDRFRRDLGGVLEAYQEVARRLWGAHRKPASQGIGAGVGELQTALTHGIWRSPRERQAGKSAVSTAVGKA